MVLLLTVEWIQEPHLAFNIPNIVMLKSFLGDF